MLTGLAALLLILGTTPPAWACPECRAQVNSGVFGPDFAATLFVMLLPVGVLALVGVGLYYADDIKAKLKRGTVKWQTARHARR
jgi:hypothetical protein